MRAEEFRTKADNCEDPQTRDFLRKVAQNYADLARQAQRMLNAEQQREHRGLDARRDSQRQRRMN
ncbi:hypothetical protein BSZ22_02545 [Bradyrhizobium canariense]|uniref:Uncharacterized protein n=1 Tax=Bradyrhizobium canariense TaxID=255045 RepID=A0A1X3HEF1_9BRAD|nr:hypothetical protein BSZ22_02545 [Bradyrhizobium canariense]OSI82358.1 hypothetical protein BSZ23_01975 [Bradyrhizobium canariense]OSI96672.1 hypothetical protein BSZ25_01615 [Bradyrhizobium canariense]OSI98397.1 hypothetical protein BSZ24_01595 [Bradyrhizobium canariense]OSJ15821.1 hypothetical protein BSZ16_01690 [Bradyrhizobium canariense]